MKSNKCPWCSVYANSVKGIIDILYHRIKIYSQIQEMLFPNQQSWAHLLCSFGVVSMSCNNELWQLWHPNHPQIKLEPSFKRQKRRILAMSKPSYSSFMPILTHHQKSISMRYTHTQTHAIVAPSTFRSQNVKNTRG